MQNLSAVKPFQVTTNMMTFSGLIKPNFRVIAIALAFLFINILLINNYYYSHDSLTLTIDHYRSKINNTGLQSTISGDKSDPPQPLLEELFQLSGDKSSYYERYLIKYLPNYSSDNLNDPNLVLLVLLILSSAPYGRDRTFNQFFNDVVRGFDVDYRKLSLGFLCLDPAEYEYIKHLLKEYFTNEEIPDSRKFNRASIVYAPFLASTGSRDDRQKLSFQKKRRLLIAKLRNFLINTVLEFETYILTVDADIVLVDPKTLQYFIESKKDIVVPRIERGAQKDYDLNSWKGLRIKPTEEEHQQMVEAQKKAMSSKTRDEDYIFVPMDRSGEMEHLEQMALLLTSNKKTKPYETVEIDSVGGAVLFLKSEIFKMGIQFPPFYVVGSDWELPLGGYDGIETEGLCYEARIIGYSCWGMPNLVAQHSNE